MAESAQQGKDGKFKTNIPSQIRDKALRRVMMGESMSSVAKDIGVAATTVQRWVKKAGIKRGQALEPEQNKLILPQPDHVMNVFEQELAKQNTEEALAMFLEMQDGVEEKYRVLMAQQLYAVFHKVMQSPPQIRSWGDAEKAHRIMADILNPKGSSRGGGATKLQIQFDVIQEKATVIDADVLEDDGLDHDHDHDEDSRD